MSKALEKALKDARKEGNLTLGSRQVLKVLNGSKLIILSRSADKGSSLAERIESGAKENNVPLVHYKGTSVTLGRMCGLQFRASSVAFSDLAETNISAIIKDAESGMEGRRS